MTEQHAATAGGHPAMDYPEHEKTYRQFTAFVKYGTLIVVLSVILLAIMTL